MVHLELNSKNRNTWEEYIEKIFSEKNGKWRYEVVGQFINKPNKVEVGECRCGRVIVSDY